MILNEEWEHRLYAERDLTSVEEGKLIMDILLIAGLWLDASVWDEVVPTLKTLGHRPVPLTLPGQGDGSASATLDDQVAAVLAAMDSSSEKPMVVGHSAACTLAWLAADARPEKVAKGVVRLADERRFDVPVVLVCPEFTPAQARKWIAAGDVPELAKAKHLDYVDIDSGHWPMLTQPIELARLLAAAAAEA